MLNQDHLADNALRTDDLITSINRLPAMRPVGLSGSAKGSNFRSPFAKPIPAAAVAITPSKRKVGEDYVPDSADEDDGEDDDAVDAMAQEQQLVYRLPQASSSSGATPNKPVTALSRAQPTQSNNSPQPSASYWSVQWRKPQASESRNR